MICCDTCPFFPTCEEEEDFMRNSLGLDEDELEYEWEPRDD